MLTVMSFGFKFGTPRADHVIDCRDIVNPHRHPKYKPLTGLNKAVQDYVMADRKAQNILREASELYLKDGKIVAFGCLGGRHRSVALAEKFAALATERGLTVRVIHRELSA